MLRITQSFISRLPLIKKNIFHQISVNNNRYQKFIHFSFSTNQTSSPQSSRDIDIKIHEQRWKNIQNNYKSLKTTFGLVVPETISKNYPKPSTIYYNLQSLRQCSNKYPQYLFQELKNKESKFHEVIDQQMNNLWKAEIKQGLEMLAFIIRWKIYEKNQEIEQMIIRTLHKFDLNMNDIFQVLKWIFGKQSFLHQNISSPADQKTFLQKLDNLHKKVLILMENKIIARLDDIDPQQYEPLFKIVNLFRLFDVYPEVKSTQKNSKQTQEGKEEQSEFFSIIQSNLLKNLNEIPPSSLVNIAVHYANNNKEDQTLKLQILEKLEQRIIFNLRFFTHQQLIALVYSYLRTSLMSKQFTQQFVQRIRLIYHDMNWQNKKKILAISSNFPFHEKLLIIAQAHNQLLKGKPLITKLQDGSIKKEFNPKTYIELDYQLVPEIYLASYENNLLTQELTKKMQEIILNNIYHYEKEQIIRSTWLFTATTSICKNDNLQRLHKKLEVIIEGGFHSAGYTIKDISILVWSLCNSGVKNQEIYKFEAKFWDNIEFYLQEKLEELINSKDQNKINNCSSILWAYTFNKALKFKTVSLITDIIIDELDHNEKAQISKNLISLQPFQLINIITFYYSLPKKSFIPSIVQRIKHLCDYYFELLHPEMSSLELMKCLKYISVDQYGDNISGQPSKLIIKLKTWENILDTFDREVDDIQYQYIMGIVGLVINSPLGRAKDKRVIKLVDKLMKKKKRMEQLKQV